MQMLRFLALATMVLASAGPSWGQIPGFDDLVGGPGDAPPPETSGDVVTGATVALAPGQTIHDLHRVMVDNDGALRTRGNEQTTEESLKALFRQHIPQFFLEGLACYIVDDSPLVPNDLFDFLRDFSCFSGESQCGIDKVFPSIGVDGGLSGFFLVFIKFRFSFPK